MTDAVPQRPMEPIVIEGAKALLPGEGMVETTVRIENGVLAEVGGTSDIKGAIRIDGRGHHLLPGVVDLHGDAFERQIMPRPGVHFPIAVALEDTDRQLVANGITTAYHAVTYSWEPGSAAGVGGGDHRRAPRGPGPAPVRHPPPYTAGDLQSRRGGGDHRLDRGRGCPPPRLQRPHPDIFGKIQKGAPLGTYLDRTGLDHDGFKAKVETVAARADEVPASIARLAEAGKKAGIPMASHDDDTVERRQYYGALGCGIAEFPMNRETSRASREMGSIAVFGAPNIPRGGSHLKGRGVRAADEVREGLCQTIVSDYYPALVQSPYVLAAEGDAAFEEAWALVSTAPAGRRPRRPGGDRGRPACGSGAGRTRRSERRPRQARPDRGDAGGRADRPPGHS